MAGVTRYGLGCCCCPHWQLWVCFSWAGWDWGSCRAWTICRSSAGPNHPSNPTSTYSATRLFFALWLTLWVSLTSTLLSVILATLCALVLRRDFPGRRWVTLVFQLNIPVPHLVGAIAVMFLFAQSGLLARVAYWIGTIAEPADFPALIFDPYGVGIILEYLWKSVPFTGIVLLAVLYAVGEEYEHVARNLGANRWQRFRYVLWPLLLPGMLRASILVLAFTFGTFEVPYLLGQTYPTVLPVLAYRKYIDVDLNARPEAMAMSMVITAIVTVLILGYMRLAEVFVRAE